LPEGTEENVGFTATFFMVVKFGKERRAVLVATGHFLSTEGRKNSVRI
jgi:hypothetical protein